MAQQITIDIVADVKKLTSGVDETNKQLGGLKTGIDKTQQAAVGLASAFVLKAGVSFLKKANEEAIDAEKTAKLAAIAFGEGSTALAKITSDADKFADSLAVDNDELIKLATTLSINLPDSAKGAATELVNLGYDVAALKGIDIEGWTNKFSKAMVDGSLSVKEMKNLIPDLNESIYLQAEALFKAGKAQEAMTLLTTEGQKAYGDAAESQVTGSQKMNKAMGDLYEMIGTKVAPIVEKLTGFIADMVDWVIKNKDVVIPLVTILGTFAAGILILNAGLTAYNAIMAAWKVATTIATTAQTIFNAVMAANPIALVILAIVAIIAIIVLLIKNWDTVTEVVGKVWDKIKNFAKDAWGALKDFGSKVADFVGDVIEGFKKLPGAMLDIGENIVKGIWNGMKSMSVWLKDKVFDFFGNLIPGWAKKVLGISSPSKVFARYGRFIVEGLAVGIERSADLAKAATEGLGIDTINSFGNVKRPILQTGTNTGAGAVNITINAGLGTNGAALGRQVSSAIKQYGKVSTKATF